MKEFIVNNPDDINYKKNKIIKKKKFNYKTKDSSGYFIDNGNVWTEYKNNKFWSNFEIYSKIDENNLTLIDKKRELLLKFENKKCYFNHYKVRNIYIKLFDIY